MEDIAPFRIQAVSIIASCAFLLLVSRLIIKGKLREEYAVFWGLSTLVLIIFSIWRNGLEVLSKLFGVYSPPNLVFLGSIFAILVYLLHLSVVVSRLHDENKKLAQAIALLTRKSSQEYEAVSKSSN
jgi:hypothetical protein